MGKITHEQFEDAMRLVYEYLEQERIHYKDVKAQVELLPATINRSAHFRIFYDAGISVRLKNILYANCERLGLHHDAQIKDLGKIPISKFLELRLFGKGCLTELEQICHLAGVKLQK